jgi:hypothetical protein
LRGVANHADFHGLARAAVQAHVVMAFVARGRFDHVPDHGYRGAIGDEVISVVVVVGSEVELSQVSVPVDGDGVGGRLLVASGEFLPHGVDVVAVGDRRPGPAGIRAGLNG